MSYQPIAVFAASIIFLFYLKMSKNPKFYLNNLIKTHMLISFLLVEIKILYQILKNLFDQKYINLY